MDNGKTRIITLRGRGVGLQKPLDSSLQIDPRVTDQLMPLPTLPPLVNPLARISLERIDFGNVPVSILLRQVLVVSNPTKDSDITVSWKIPGVWPDECKF